MTAYCLMHNWRIDDPSLSHNAALRRAQRLIWTIWAEPEELRQPEISATKRLRIFRRDEHTCCYCGNAGGDLTVDHRLPVSMGGDDSDDNLCTACRRCNSSKRDREAPAG